MAHFRVRRGRFAGPGIAIITFCLIACAVLALESWLSRKFLSTEYESPHLWVSRHYYREIDRSIAQYEPSCMQPDDTLGYLLSPSGCTFRNREFSTTLRGNSLGLRDDDLSTIQPDVIILGDSHAMGWGVEADESFSSILEAHTGKRVLNAGISSFGTVRELLLSHRLDLSKTPVVVIQYNSSDQGENEEFLRNQALFNQELSSRFESATHEYRNFPRDFPGTFILRFLPLLARSTYDPQLAFREPTWRRGEFEADLFLRVIQALLPQNRFSGIIVIDITGHNQNTSEFVDAVERQKEKYPGPIMTLDLQPHLKDEDYFVLDDHLNRAGHRKVGRALAEILLLE